MWPRFTDDTFPTHVDASIPLNFDEKKIHWWTIIIIFKWTQQESYEVMCFWFFFILDGLQEPVAS